MAALLVSGQGLAIAAQVVPAQLTGTWGTAESLYAGNVGQAELHLEADGLGIMAGSTPPPVRLDGVDDGKPMPRAIIGFPLRVTFIDDEMRVYPIAHGTERVKMPGHAHLTCRYDNAKETLTCAGPSGPPILLTRRHAYVAPEAARMIKELRAGTSTK